MSSLVTSGPQVQAKSLATYWSIQYLWVQNKNTATVNPAPFDSFEYNLHKMSPRIGNIVENQVFDLTTWLWRRRLCLSTLPNFQKKVENTWSNVAQYFLINFKVFGNVVKYCLVFDIISQFQLKLSRSREMEILKMYPN